MAGVRFNPVREAGAEHDLAAVLRTVQETEADGRIKFAPATYRALARMIAARAYAKPVTELCHLIAAAAACDPARRYEPFFWASGPARPAGFKAWFAKAQNSNLMRAPVVAVHGHGVALAYGGNLHAIAFGRMPVLSALAEFLLTALGYGDVDATLVPLLESPQERRKVENVANALSRQIHAYLSSRLPSAQNLRKFRDMTRFLADRGAGGAVPDAIDDGTILDFWLARSAAPEADTLGVKTYRSVFRSFVTLQGVLAESRERFRLDHPRSLGPEAKAGEIDPERVSESLEAVSEGIDPLKALAAPPASAIKFYNGRETKALREALFAGPRAAELALSVFRNSLFGDAQARLSASDELGRHTEALIDGDYHDRIGAYLRLADHGRSVLLATLHVLIRLRRAEAAALIAALDPDADLGGLRDKLDIAADAKVSVLPGASPVERFLRALDEAPESLGHRFARLAAAARAAYRSVARTGFRREDMGKEDVVEGFASAGDPLIRISATLLRFTKAIEEPSIDWRARYQDDKAVFLRQFHLIYGDDHDQAAE